MDSHTFETSVSSQENEFIFTNKTYGSVADTNNGFYPQGTITFDLGSLANSGKLVDWGNSYLHIPLIAKVSGDITDDVMNCHSFSMKNHYNLIDSISCQITNMECVNTTSFTNLDINYKILSTWSVDTLNNLGPSLGVYKDSGFIRPVGVPSGGSAIGLGECHNEIDDSLFKETDGGEEPSGTAGSGQDGFTYNVARILRMAESNNDLTNDTGNVYLKKSNADAMQKSYCVRSSTDKTVTYYMVAIIRLRDIHDLFAKLPLTRNMYMKLSIRTNAVSSCTLTYKSGKYTTYSSSTSGSCIPFQISPLGSGLKVDATITDAKTINVEMGICKLANGTGPTPHGSACRIFACMYNMVEDVQREYFLNNAVKRVQYNDLQTHLIKDVGIGASIEKIVTNSVARVRSVLIVPVLSASVHGALAINAGSLGSNTSLGSVFNSPFSSAPTTCAPYGHIGNFNIYVNGTPHYPENINYSWLQFLNESRGSNALNGGLTDALSSGLISQKDFYNGYGFIYVDLSRRQSQARDNETKSIEVKGTNLSNRVMDYHVIINYQRELNISTSTGALVWDAN